MIRANRHLFRSPQLASLAAALAALAGCAAPDPTNFACTSSAECPSGYHCNLGTASTAGTFKCASGAPQQKTLSANATLFQLVTKPNLDGSIRTTIAAAVGAVTSTPDFVGVRVIASQGGKDVAESQVAADGSALEFQLPSATAQVSLRVQDDSGHSIPVTGYNQQVELSFVGRDVAGTSNPNDAFDVTTTSDSHYDPATWISTGPGPGGRSTEFAMADTVLPDGGIVSSASYASLASQDYTSAAAVTPAQLQDPTPTSPGTTAGWYEFSQIPTSDNPDGGPPARVNATLASVSGGQVILYGGTDATGTAADLAGTFWGFNTTSGWTPVVPPAGANAVPTGGAKSLVGIGYGGSTGCATFPCQTFSLAFSMAGGLGPSGFPTNRVVAFGTQSAIQTSTSPAVVTATGWFDVGTLPFANAGMASAPAQIPISNSTTSGTSETFAGLIMAGGQGIAAGSAGTNSNDQNGCMLYAGYPFGSTSPVANRSISCTDPTNWPTTTGAIGYRTGATLIPVDAQTFLLFGGLKQGGVNPGLKNDLWKGTLACNVIVPNPFCTTQVTWVQVSPAGTPPPARANAGGAAWQATFVFTPTFALHRRFAIYGGTGAGGATLNDFWEYDVDANAWRQVPFDGGSALAPRARTQFAMAGDGSHAYVFGGQIGTAASDQMWVTTREAPSRILVRAPFSVPAIDQMTSSTITVDASGFISGQAYLWDGVRWRYVGTSAFDGGGFHLLARPTAPVTAFLQASGDIYLLLLGLDRATPSFGGGPASLDRVKMTVDFR